MPFMPGVLTVELCVVVLVVAAGTITLILSTLARRVQYETAVQDLAMRARRAREEYHRRISRVREVGEIDILDDAEDSALGASDPLTQRHAA